MPSAAKKLQTEPSLKLSVERAVFLKALGRLQNIVEKRNTLPILSNIKIEANASTLSLTATDMDLVASETIAATTDTSGALTVPAQTLYEIVRKLPDGSVISLEGDAEASQLVVKAGNAEFKLSYLPAEDFPLISEGDLTHRFSLPAKDCLTMIDKARFAMSTEETRYYLNGVYLHQAKNDKEAVLRAVSTDGHRLARIQISLPKGALGLPGVIVPRKAVNELKKLLEESNAEIEVGLSDTKIRFHSGNVVILSKLIDGTFPDYERVIPSSNDKTMEVDTKALTRAVDRVSTISTEKTRGIKFSLSPGKLLLSANSPENGTAVEEITVNYTSTPLETGFNSRYVLDMMSQLEGETTQFLFSDSVSPALVRDPSDISALYVIMPMRV